MKRQKLLIALLISVLFSHSALAAFSDLPSSHENYQAIEYLNTNGIIDGYPDGTFKPDQNVIRAESVKIVLNPIYENIEDTTENPFPDVTPDLWFAKYVNQAKNDGFVSGDGQTGNFEATRNVNLVEYLKMITLAYDVDLAPFENPTTYIFNDAQDLNQWYIPYLHYASATNLIHSDSQNNIYPAKELTRGEVAEITYRIIINLKGGDTQLYLSMAEAEMVKILQYLDVNDIDNAEISARNAVSYTTSALESKPDEAIVQAANKIAYAFQKLVGGYRAGLDEDYERIETLSVEAWDLATEAESIDSSVSSLATTIKDIAHTMAENARTMNP